MSTRKTVSTKSLAPFAVLIAAAGAAASPFPALAAEPVADPFAGEGNPQDPTHAGAASTGPAPAEATPPPESAGTPIVVERMPPSAYPEWRTRGILGGSLWLDPSFHGMQWPYYPRTGIGVGGSVWADNAYQQINREERYPKTNYWVHQSRALLRVTPTYTSGDFFVQGQVELVGNSNQRLQRFDGPDTDDLWVRVGRWNKWDIQLGRFEAYALHHFGMGLDINTVERQGALDENSRQPVDFYYATTMYYRPNGVGNAAFHLYLWEGNKHLPAVRLEMLAQYGYDTLDRLGARPAAVVDFGFAKIKLGGEYRLSRARDTQVETILDPVTGMPTGYRHTRNEKFEERGAAGSVQFVLFPWLEAGVSGGYGLSDHTTQMGGIDVDGGSFTQWTVGGFANVSPLSGVVVGAGAHLTDWTNLHQNDLGQFGHQTNLAAFGAVQVLVMKQLYIKLVGAFDRGMRENLEGGTTRVENTMISTRLRLMYLF